MLINEIIELNNEIILSRKDKLERRHMQACGVSQDE